jgi:hypothetical protein
MIPGPKPSILLNPSDFNVPANCFYPCFCPSCRPRVRRTRALLQPLEVFLTPRIGAPVANATNRNSSDGLLELYTPLLCRKHSGGRDTVKLYAEPSFLIRRRRVLAFLYRCMTTPQDIEDYIRLMPSRTWLPVPLDNFVGHALDAPLIRNIRKALTDAGMMLDVPLFGNRLNAPLITSAAFVADKLDDLANLITPSAAVLLVKLWADLCAKDGAVDDPNETIRTIAKRVAFAPDPRDVWPWVPRWGPAQIGPEDTVNTRPGLVVPRELRRWWNFNGPTLRPDVFANDPNALARHREAVAQLYMMPTSTASGGPVPQRVVASLNHVT